MIYRKITPKLLDALTDSPVVLLHGARQTGKSTLLKNIIESEFKARYLTFDDPGLLSAAQNNPLEFLSSYNENLALDEIQRAPGIFLAIKNLVDKDRKSRSFLLTGSSNVFLLPKISESLAGRIEILNLFPLAQSEISGSKFNLTDEILNKEFGVSGLHFSKENLIEKIIKGGFPEMLSRKDRSRQEAWFKSYLTTILQRDVRDISNIDKLNDLPKLLRIFSARAGTLLNFAELSRSSSIPQTTLKRYIFLLEAVFLIYILPAWSGNLSKRLIKTPKIYLADTGLLSHLTAFEPGKIVRDPLLWGRVLENFVMMELVKLSSWSKFILSLYHFRTSSGQEVDFIIERNDGMLIGIEVKATSKINNDMFNHLRILSNETKNKFLRGIIIYTGSEIIPFSKNLFALPVNLLW